MENKETIDKINNYLIMLSSGFSDAEKDYGYDLGNEKHYVSELKNLVKKLNIPVTSKPEPKEETILESIKRIIEDVSGIQDLFIVSRVQKYVAYRSLFDYLIQHYTGFTYIGIADYSGRHRATVKNSLDNYKGYSKDALYEENFDAIINIYLETKNHE